MEFDLEQHHSLLTVFDKTGRALFADSWLGMEAWAIRTDDPEMIQQERDQLRAEIEALWDEREQVSRRMNLPGLSSAERAPLQTEWHDRHRQYEDAKNRLADLPKVDNWLRKDSAAYQRRLKTEKMLNTAFRSEELTILFGAKLTEVKWSYWSHYDAFEVSFTMACVRAPSEIISSGRMELGFVRRDQFRNWLIAQGFSPPDEPPLSVYERAEKWAEKFVQSNANSRSRKAQFVNSIRTEFPGLSERQAGKIWSSTAPEEWKLGGRPRKTD